MHPESSRVRATNLHLALVLCLLQQAVATNTSTTLADDVASAAAAARAAANHERELYRLAKSADMRAYMKTSVNPCEDFYAYACGNWARVNPPNRNLKTATFDAITKGYNARVQRFLAAPKLTTESDMQRKVKYFYESCLDRAQMRRRYRAKLLAIAEEFGGLPALKGDQWRADQFDWQQVAARILRKYGRNVIIGIYIAPDLNNNEVNRLYVGQWDDLVTPSASAHYERKKWTRAAELVSVLGVSAGTAMKAALEMTHFERELAAGMSDPLDGLGMADLTRLRLLDEMAETYKPALNVSALVAAWLGYDYRLPVHEYVESYLVNLRRVLMNTPPAVVANYMVWQLLQDFRLEAGETADEQRSKCVDVTRQHFFKYLDRTLYGQLQHAQPQKFSDVEVVWRQLKQAFELVLQSNRTAAWLTEMTRDKALEKLSAATLTVSAFSDEDIEREFGALVVSTNNFFYNLVNVVELRGHNLRQRLEAPPQLDTDAELSFSAAYVPEQNRVLMPVAYLLPYYLWDERYPAALKYATLGYTLGHELAHAFDDELRKYNAQGNLNDWWDRASTEAYAERKDCFKQQMSEFRFRGLRMPLSNAQDENLADNVGVRLAYAAYEEWLLQQQLNASAMASERLPHLGFSGRQLFFVGLSQLWCAETRPVWRRTAALTDVHPPEELRITSMLANFDAFAGEFSCHRGSPMHPHRKCSLF